MAKEQVHAFVAIVFQRFKLHMAPETNQKFPVLVESTPSLGITRSVEGVDVILDMVEALMSRGWTFYIDVEAGCYRCCILPD
jgi:hypothetical protein